MIQAVVNNKNKFMGFVSGETKTELEEKARKYGYFRYGKIIIK